MKGNLSWDCSPLVKHLPNVLQVLDLITSTRKLGKPNPSMHYLPGVGFFFQHIAILLCLPHRVSERQLLVYSYYIHYVFLWKIVITWKTVLLALEPSSLYLNPGSTSHWLRCFEQITKLSCPSVHKMSILRSRILVRNERLELLKGEKWF
jgi:hypothetical protein